MLCDREGYRRFGVALAMCHRLVVYGLMTTEREMSTPPTLHTGAWSTLLLYCCCSDCYDAIIILLVVTRMY